MAKRRMLCRWRVDTRLPLYVVLGAGDSRMANVRESSAWLSLPVSWTSAVFHDK